MDDQYDGHDDHNNEDHNDDDQEANVPWRNNLSRSDVVWHGKRSPPRKYKFAASEVVSTAEQSGSFSANCENWYKYKYKYLHKAPNTNQF